MSYTPNDQLLGDPIQSILNGIDDFMDAANNRIANSSDWNQLHILELKEWNKRLPDIKLDLMTYKNEVR